jgi:long-chain acyl-CoA synthetase
MEPSHFHTLSELFLKAAETHAKPDAFLTKQNGRYQGLSSAEALRQTAALALALDRLGIRRGDRLALISENRVEWALADYAALGFGAIDVPIYPTLPAADVEYILQDSGSRGVIVSTAEQLQKVLEVRCRLPELRFIIAMESQGNPEAGVLPWQSVIHEQLQHTPNPEEKFRALALQARPDDTATILYTSGTTGRPKGVVLTHANIASNVQACSPLFHFDPSDRIVSFLPLSHIFERMLEYFTFWSGASIAYAESFEKLPQNILEVRPTVLAVVPRVLEKVHGKILEAVRQSPPARQKLFHWAIGIGWQYSRRRLENQSIPLALRLKHEVADHLVASKVRARLGGKLRFMISGSAPLSRELAEFFYAVGLPVYEGYGLTETSPVISVNYPGAVKLGTVGRVIPGVEVKLGEEAAGSEGASGREILVRGPNVSPGYYHPEENGEAFVDGWFRTGDLGTLDSEGYLKITGRKKNLFKTSGGKYISPEKLEGLFQGHPYVSQLMVLGDSRRFVAALIVPNFDRLEAYAREQGICWATRQELVTHPEICTFMQRQVDEACQGLAPFERIRQIALLPSEFTTDNGELSPSLKVRRFIVEERYRELIEEIYRRPAPQAQTASLSR